MKTATSASRVRIDPLVFRDVTWWSWIVMIGLLIMRFVTGSTAPTLAAAALCIVLAASDIVLRRGDLKAMSVQIRLGYTLLLLIGLLPWMQWVHMVQLIGTSARVLSGYCLLHRELLLCGWNRQEPLSIRVAQRVVLAPPGPGGLVRFTSDSPNLPNPCGSVV